ncbi:MAG TPA: hypothetical protein VH158_05675 [Gemmatimonadales bacterium]|nr:hypothetical protein [Gemmatimonadales bacterium]
MASGIRRTMLAGIVATVGCNEGLRPTIGCPGICGTVTYAGQLPDSLKDSTDAVFVLTYRTFPQAPTDLFTFQPIPPPTVPAGGLPHRYALPLPPGTYEWVLAVWKKKSAEALSAQNADTLLREVGFYRDDGDTTRRGTGVVLVRTGTDSINFVIDFSNMHRICTYFPPCP